MVVGLLLMSATVSSVFAATITGGNIVNFADTEVSADTTLDTVIVMNGNATIAGKIKEDVVVVNGNAILAPTANIRERVIVLGGNLEAQPGAVIGKGVFHIGGNYPIASTLAAAGLIVLLLGFIKIVITITVIVIPILLAWLSKTKTQETSEIITQNPGKTVVTGLLGSLAVAALCVLLAFTLIGIPVAFILVLVVMAVSVWGLGAVCCAIGHVLPLKTVPGERGTFMSTLYGAILLGLVFNVPFVGFIILKVCLLVAFGAAIIGFFSRKSQNT